MSLINKMLQDLDARGSQAGQGLPLDIKSVARGERQVPLPVLLASAVAVVAIVVGGFYGWRYLKRPAPEPLASVAVAVPAPAAASPPAAAPVPAPAPLAVLPAPAPVVSQPREVARRATAAVVAAPAKVNPVPPTKVSEPAAPLVKATPEAIGEGRQSTAHQRAEAEYRRALANLAEGRITEAMESLERSLQIEPRHDAARQTLVGLLIEAKRRDEAVRLLETGLALDARQPSMAMLLARLQIESGGPAIDTLMRTLPYAAGNGEYHAFLAGALQREERHREAAEQYQAALRAVPANGVWWMGLGISMQAEKRNAEALAAYERARDSGSLTPQLSAFVERKLQGLAK